ncbi:hypothetical protein Tco_1217123, partial [Tanacetum coccineum]
ILKIIQDWDEKQIESWNFPEVLRQLTNDSQTIAEMFKEQREKRIEEEKRIEHKQEEQAKEDLMDSIQTFLKKFSRIPFGETPKILLLAWEKFGEIKYAQPEDVQELLHRLLKDLQIINEEFAEYINSPSWNRPTFVDDDDAVFYTILSAAITPDLPTKESENSLNMGDEHLDTIPETEKSSVEDLVPIPSESNDISEDECDLPVCENSSSQFTTFSNPLYEMDEDFSSSDDESILEDDIPVGTFKTYSNPLFEVDEEIISSEKLDDNVVNDHFDVESCLIESLVNHDTLIDFSPKINYFLDEFAGELALF